MAPPCVLSAFALDLLGCGVYTLPPGVPGAMFFHDPLEGTEISNPELLVCNGRSAAPLERGSAALRSFL